MANGKLSVQSAEQLPQNFATSRSAPRIDSRLSNTFKAIKKEGNTMSKARGLVRQNGMFLGVCGGLAARYGLSPFIVRLIFVLLLLPGGLPGLLPYFILAILMPKA